MKEKGGSEKCFDCKHIYNINLTIPYLDGGIHKWANPNSI